MVTESLNHALLSGQAQIHTRQLEKLFRYKPRAQSIGRVALSNLTAQLRIWHVDSETNSPPSPEATSTYESTRPETGVFVVSAIERVIRTNDSDEGLVDESEPIQDTTELSGSLLIHSPSFHEARKDEYAGRNITYKWTKLEVDKEPHDEHHNVRLYSRIDSLSVAHLLDADTDHS